MRKAKDQQLKPIRLSKKAAAAVLMVGEDTIDGLIKRGVLTDLRGPMERRRGKPVSLATGEVEAYGIDGEDGARFYREAKKKRLQEAAKTA